MLLPENTSCLSGPQGSLSPSPIHIHRRAAARRVQRIPAVTWALVSTRSHDERKRNGTERNPAAHWSWPDLGSTRTWVCRGQERGRQRHGCRQQLPRHRLEPPVTATPHPWVVVPPDLRSCRTREASVAAAASLARLACACSRRRRVPDSRAARRPWPLEPASAPLPGAPTRRRLVGVVSRGRATAMWIAGWGQEGIFRVSATFILT
jgi:hypothetical protein